VETVKNINRQILLYSVPQVMLYAQLRDNNQGIIKITTGGMNRSATAGTITTEKETRLSALLNGNNQAGMLVLHKAMEMAVEKAKAHGFGIVGTNHTSTSTGALGFYAEQVNPDLVESFKALAMQEAAVSEANASCV
jgi:LDH2 family malate/lactate/ureidoglycolate dehydrogenase